MTPEGRPHLQAREIESRIIGFIERELMDPGETINRNDDLLSGEFFDSIGVLRLATFVEEDFRIDMQPSDFVIENFQTVDALAKFILRTVSGS
jgi:acyl carrier protein